MSELIKVNLSKKYAMKIEVRLLYVLEADVEDVHTFAEAADQTLPFSDHF